MWHFFGQFWVNVAFFGQFWLLLTRFQTFADGPMTPRCRHNFIKYWPIFRILSLANSAYICSKVIIKDSTSLQMLYYTTLRNVNVRIIYQIKYWQFDNVWVVFLVILYCTCTEMAPCESTVNILITCRIQCQWRPMLVFQQDTPSPSAHKTPVFWDGHSWWQWMKA